MFSNHNIGVKGTQILKFRRASSHRVHLKQQLDQVPLLVFLFLDQMDRQLVKVFAALLVGPYAKFHTSPSWSTWDSRLR